MKTIRFLQTEQYESEGRNKGPVFIAGDVHVLEDDFADRWIRRGLAELVDLEAEQADLDSAAEAAAQLAALEQAHADMAAAIQAEADKVAADKAAADLAAAENAAAEKIEADKPADLKAAARKSAKL